MLHSLWKHFMLTIKHVQKTLTVGYLNERKLLMQELRIKRREGIWSKECDSIASLRYLCTLQLGWVWPLALTVLYSDMQRFCCLVMGTVQGFPITINYWNTVVSWKSANGRSTVQISQRGGWALFWVFLHLTTKECPCHVHSYLIPSKQQTATYNGITSGFQVKFWRHTTFWMAWAWCSSQCPPH